MDKHIISDETYIVVQNLGVIEIWNDLEDGSRTGACITYDEISRLIVQLREVQNHIYDLVIRDVIAVRYLLLMMNAMATKSLVEDIVLLRWEVPRSVIHEVLNRLEANGHTAFKREAARFVWTEPRMNAPDPDDYPEIETVLQRQGDHHA